MSPEMPQGFSDLVGLEFTDIGPGYSRGTVDVTDELKNPTGVVHGAVLYTMADTGMAAALQSELAEDERCATIELKINYLRAVRDGTVTCETELLHRGRSTAYLEATLENDGETVARATGSFSILGA
ncbi:PaaI family thioesterase [Natronolimnohabitans innermongolicus]|uniref:Phenylacetic acid degradation-related protein n=1 Tax=Natronolimnohabitans innermongolicus JCM 12255 TaxID=1227499 RepID=L9XJW6_9EURY|nr:PaaI family thioesterase [Natronolimnohabitans innermongolicus]ELY62054.1 phenylacetic acid degradation-related protein [Natronolimnohabitans innermongolicus JCM 12255]